MAKNVQLNYTHQPELTYPKIQTLYKRTTKGEIILDELTHEHFSIFPQWRFFEKIHGTNVRVIWHGNPIGERPYVQFRGKNDNSEMHRPLYEYLEQTFTEELLDPVFTTETAEGKIMKPKVILFGEGFGAGIMKGGGNYQQTPKFILFDGYIEGWWLERDKLEEIATQLNIQIVPQIGIMTKDEIVEFVQSKPKSLIAENKDFIMEGVVVQCEPLVLFRNGNPLKWKLKERDFRRVKDEKKTVRIKSPRRYGEQHLTEEELHKQRTNRLYENDPSLNQLDEEILKKIEEGKKK